jgi:hypothetical protein
MQFSLNADAAVMFIAEQTLLDYPEVQISRFGNYESFLQAALS